MRFYDSPILLIWYIVYIVQAFFAYGTAYRYTKNGGDNGVALFGWLLLFGLASIIPGLGIYLWYKSKKEDEVNQSTDNDQADKDGLDY
jgi:hypothetical protein